MRGTAEGPIMFIVCYYVVQVLVEAYIAETTSLSWLGSLAGNLFGNLITLTAIPWILAILGFWNRYIAWKYKRSFPKVVVEEVA